MNKVVSPLLIAAALICPLAAEAANSGRLDKPFKVKLDKSAKRGLDWLVSQQNPRGYWSANNGQYRIAMTALSGMAMLCEGSTVNSGKYRDSIRKAVDYLVNSTKTNGLIGYEKDYRYTYGHGFSMLFLAQVYGDEEDPDRRKELKRVLTKAVEFSVNAQTNRGGWGYVSAKDGNQFDEGSTCVTQVQGLRACRNAGIPVPKKCIEAARKYIRDCTVPNGTYAGGLYYSFQSRGSARPAISAAAVAVMFNAGEYKTKQVQSMLGYCKKYVWPGGSTSSSHWHYKHFYYAQVMFRLGGRKDYEKDWIKYMDDVGNKILKQQSANGSWGGNHVGGVYTTAINSIILQLHKNYVPIYQR